MKKLLLIFSSAVMFSCINTSNRVIDGCDYIVTTSITSHGSVESLTHKGNCKNPIHFSPVKEDTLRLNIIQTPLK